MVIYTSPSKGTYEIEVTYSGTANQKKIAGLGTWLQGDYSYEDGSATGITSEAPNVNSYAVGTAFIWDWQNQGPQFSKGETKTQYFNFTPAETPPLDLAWVLSSSNDIWLSTGGIFSSYNIISTAISDTGKYTKIVAHPVSEGSEGLYTISILTWEINPPS